MILYQSKFVKAICLLLLIFLCANAAYATEFFVRPAGGNYGLENGTDFSDAWKGFDSIDWNMLKGGDTLYVSGVFTEIFKVKGGGNPGQDLRIRGDHARGEGIIQGANIGWNSINSNHITVSGIKIIDGVIKYLDSQSPNGPYTATNIEFISPNIIRDPNKGFISHNVQPGQVIGPHNCSGCLNRQAYLIESVTDQGAYEEIIIDLTEGGASIVDDIHDKRFETIWPNHHITIENSYISSSTNKQLIEIIGTDITIRNNELDGQNADTHGMLYIFNSQLHKIHKNITIEGNYIHGAGSNLTNNNDNHCIGIQGVDGLLITKNHLENCAAGIVFWHGSSKPLTNWEVSYNLIEGMDHNLQPGQWGGGGIIFSGSDSGPNNTDGIVAHNVIVNPINCPHGPNIGITCIGIRTKLEKTAYIHNNTIVGYDTGIEIRPGASADVQNNVITENFLHHISVTNPLVYVEDYNIYYPDSGSSFRYSGVDSDFITYNTNNPHLVNSNSSIDDPLLNLQFGPISDLSPAVDSGTDLARPYLATANWPTRPGGGNFVFVVDPTPDIGAISFEAIGVSGAIVSFTLPSATDDVDPSPKVTASPASGTFFIMGTTSVTVIATDKAGNKSQVNFTVTVADTTAPVLSQPPDVTAEATGVRGAVVNFPLPSAVDSVDPAPTVRAIPASGMMFALGATVVTVMATDAAGNQSQVSFTVTVADTTAPVLSQPANVTVEAMGVGGAL